LNGVPERFRHIVVEGAIGVGKSSLARRLGRHLGADLMLEKPQDNPFLERFYADPSRNAFQTQLFFLFQRMEQMRELSQPGMFSRGVVSDFLFAKDSLFAALTLSAEEYRLYTQIHAQIATQVPEPDLVLWLRASPATLLGRVRQRAIGMERAISVDYLARLSDAYSDHFERYQGAPVLAIDTDRFNPAHSDADFEALLGRIAHFKGPRQLFDPSTAWSLD
jgi:deoxyguanosine kinase